VNDGNDGALFALGLQEQVRKTKSAPAIKRWCQTGRFAKWYFDIRKIVHSRFWVVTPNFCCEGVGDPSRRRETSSLIFNHTSFGFFRWCLLLNPTGIGDERAEPLMSGAGMNPFMPDKFVDQSLGFERKLADDQSMLVDQGLAMPSEKPAGYTR
jgi:hypothetical protein